jgi:hypothetical protein
MRTTKIVALMFAIMATLIGSFAGNAEAADKAPRRHQLREEAIKAFKAEIGAVSSRPMDAEEELESRGVYRGVEISELRRFEAKASTNGVGVPGTLKLYNASSSTNRYILRFVVNTGKDWATRFVQDIPVQLPQGSVIEFPLQRWGRWRVRLFSDTDVNGVKSTGDALVTSDQFKLVKTWWTRWGTRTRNLILTGSGGNPNPNPNPSGYPNGSVVVVNAIASTGDWRLTKGTFNGSQYAFPSVPEGSYGYVTGFYGTVAVSAEFVSGATTGTASTNIQGPANASAAAAVWTVTTVAVP